MNSETRQRCEKKIWRANETKKAGFKLGFSKKTRKNVYKKCSAQ